MDEKGTLSMCLPVVGNPPAAGEGLDTILLLAGCSITLEAVQLTPWSPYTVHADSVWVGTRRRAIYVHAWHHMNSFKRFQWVFNTIDCVNTQEGGAGAGVQLGGSFGTAGKACRAAHKQQMWSTTVCHTGCCTSCLPA